MEKTVLIRCDDVMWQFIDTQSKDLCLSKSGWLRMMVKEIQNRLKDKTLN